MLSLLALILINFASHILSAPLESPELVERNIFDNLWPWSHVNTEQNFDPNTADVGDVITLNLTDHVQDPYNEYLLVFYNNVTCTANPIRDFTFANGTVANVTWGDVLSDTHDAWTGRPGKSARAEVINNIKSSVQGVIDDADYIMGFFNFTDFDNPPTPAPQDVSANPSLLQSVRNSRTALRRKILSNGKDIEAGDCPFPDDGSDQCPLDGGDGGDDNGNADAGGSPDDDPGSLSFDPPSPRSAIPKATIAIYTVGSFGVWGTGWCILTMWNHQNKQQYINSIFGSSLLTIGYVGYGILDVAHKRQTNMQEQQIIALQATVQTLKDMVGNTRLIAAKNKVIPAVRSASGQTYRKTKTSVAPWGYAWKRWFGFSSSGGEQDSGQDGAAQAPAHDPAGGADGDILAGDVFEPGSDEAGPSGVTDIQERLPRGMRSFDEIQAAINTQPQCAPGDKGKGKAVYEVPDGYYTPDEFPDDSDSD